MIAAGGTGGHVYPAIAVARELRQRDPEAEIVFVGTKKGFEAKLVPSEGFDIEYVEIGGIHSKSIFTKFQNILLLPKAFYLTNQLLNKYKPDVVFGIGGYTAGPLLLLAGLKKIPTAILEANAIAGRTNRWLGKFASKIFLAFKEAQKYFPKSKCVYSGNPLREEILSIASPDFSASKKVVFIFGGSQGARRINLGIVDMIQKNPAEWKKYSFIHQTGEHEFEAVRSAYQSHGIEADVRKYFDNISDSYGKCHFVIARSGSSILEIAAAGRPSLLIPYPFAADQHQLANAQAFSKTGAAFLLEDHQCNGDNLYSLLQPILSSDAALEKMSKQALQFRKEHASKQIVEQFFAWAGR